MKKFINQKWMLSAFLVAALGSQYYYSVSSQQLMTADFASTAKVTPDDINKLIVALPATEGSKTTTSISGNKTTIVYDSGISTSSNIVPPVVRDAVAKLPQGTSKATVDGAVTTIVVDTGEPAATTQGTIPSKCTDCQIWTLTNDQARIIETSLKDYLAIVKKGEAKPEDNTKEVAAKKETPEEFCADEETESAKKRCVREEKDRRQTAKEEDDRELRAFDFEDKMKEISIKYGTNLESLSLKFVSLMKSYSGKNDVNPSIVMAMYGKYIQPLLKDELSAMDEASDSTRRVISSLMESTYVDVKKAVVAELNRASMVRAAAIRAALVEAKQVFNTDAMQSQMLLQQASQDRLQLVSDYYGYKGYNVSTGGYMEILTKQLQVKKDPAWGFATTGLIQPVKQLFSNLEAEENNFLNIQYANGQQVTGNTRGARIDLNLQQQHQLQQQQLGAQAQAQPQNNGSMQFGNPSQQPQGTRGGRGQ